MRIHVENTVQKITLKIEGKFIFGKLALVESSFRNLLDQEACQLLEIDMQLVRHFDSSALGMLLHLREKAHSLGKTVQLSNPSQYVAQALKNANFDKIFAIAW